MSSPAIHAARPSATAIGQGRPPDPRHRHGRNRCVTTVPGPRRLVAVGVSDCDAGRCLPMGPPGVRWSIVGETLIHRRGCLSGPRPKLWEPRMRTAASSLATGTLAFWFQGPEPKRQSSRAAARNLPRNANVGALIPKAGSKTPKFRSACSLGYVSVRRLRRAPDRSRRWNGRPSVRWSIPSETPPSSGCLPAMEAAVCRDCRVGD